MKIILLNQAEVRLADIGDLAIDPMEYESLDFNALDHRFVFGYPLAEVDSAMIVEENKVAVETLDGDFRLYRIVTRNVEIVGQEQIVRAECDAIFYELFEKEFVDVAYGGASPTVILSSILSGSGWSVGTVDATGTLLGDGPGLMDPYRAILELAAATGTEPFFRVTVLGPAISARYVDLLTPDSFSGKRFELSRDMAGVKISVETGHIKTALYGSGEGEELDVDGNLTRIDFSTVTWVTGVATPLYDGGPTSPAPLDKPAGQKYLADPAKLADYGIWNPTASAMGHRFGLYESTAKDPYALLWATYYQLVQTVEPIINVEASVITLEEITGFEHEKVRLGMSVVVKIDDLDPLAARVIRIQRHRKDASQTRVELGNFRPTSSELMSDIRRSLSDFNGRSGIWDRSRLLNPDGTVPTSALDGIIDAVTNQIGIGGGSVVADGDGLWVYDSATPATSLGAIRMVAYGGEAALAVGSRALITDPWTWRAGITSDGFSVFGDEIVSGTLKTSLVKIEGDTKFYWDATSLYVIDPTDSNNQIRLGKYDGTNYGLGFTVDGGSNWTVGIGFDGVRADKLVAGGSNRIEIKNGAIRFYTGGSLSHTLSYNRYVPNIKIGNYWDAITNTMASTPSSQTSLQEGFSNYGQIWTGIFVLTTAASVAAGSQSSHNGQTIPGADLADIRNIAGIACNSSAGEWLGSVVGWVLDPSNSYIEKLNIRLRNVTEGTITSMTVRLTVTIYYFA